MALILVLVPLFFRTITLLTPPSIQNKYSTQIFSFTTFTKFIDVLKGNHSNRFQIKVRVKAQVSAYVVLQKVKLPFKSALTVALVCLNCGQVTFYAVEPKILAWYSCPFIFKNTAPYSPQVSLPIERTAVIGCYWFCNPR